MNTCILLAGGVGSRTGLDIPKQFVEVDGKPVFCYSAEIIDKCTEINCIIIVTLVEWMGFVQKWIQKLGLSKVKYIVEEGVSRQYSILNGLRKAREFLEESDIIMIHDSARPVISPNVIKNAIKTAEEKGSAIPVLRINDSVYVSEDGKYINHTLPKSSVYIGQTPVCFNFGLYYRLNIDSEHEAIMKSTSSCDLLFRKGIEVAIVEGDPDTFKITAREDIERFSVYLKIKKIAD